MTHLILTAYHWVIDNWPILLALIGGAGALSVLLETLLNKLHVNSKKIAYTAIHILSIVTAVAAYALATLPTTDVPAIYAGIVILAQTWHRFIVSPAYTKFLVPYLTFVADQKTTTNVVVSPTLAPASTTPIPAPAEFSV